MKKTNKPKVAQDKKLTLVKEIVHKHLLASVVGGQPTCTTTLNSCSAA